MLGFGQKKSPPPLCSGNPGIGVDGRTGFSTGTRSWTEEFNLVSIAASVFKTRNISVGKEPTWLEHAESGFIIQPQLVGLQPLDDGGVQTVTTIQVNHPRWISEGLFEYQHSTGNSIAEAVSWGFDQWVQTDFVTLLDAVRPRPETCTFMEMISPATEGKPQRIRRAILGPVAHFMEKPPARAEDDPHPFCPCCLLTNTFEAFRELLESDGFHGLRFFAARDAQGQPQADCRVNGEDLEPGAVALRKYVGTWPTAGFEFRKQYVVLQTVEKSAAQTDAGNP
jgi:hypothetical protein